MTTPDKTADEIMFGHLTEYANAELTRHALLCARVDWAYPAPEPPPFTTIGWRLTHIAMMLDMRADHHFGPKTMGAEDISWPGTAEAALAWTDRAWAAFRTGAAALADSDLDRCSAGPPGTADEHFPLAMTIQHLTLECIHHGAEVTPVRDLHRVRSGPS